MFKIFQWSVNMARQLKKAVRRLPSSWPRVELIPIIDESKNAYLRKKEIQNILSVMLMSARKRGRPVKNRNPEELSDAA